MSVTWSIPVFCHPNGLCVFAVQCECLLTWMEACPASLVRVSLPYPYPTLTLTRPYPTPS